MDSLRILILTLGLILLGSPKTIEAADRIAREKFFEARIRPALLKHCHGCHGERQQRGQLRLDSRDALLKGGESGPAVVPGDSSASLLIEAIRHESLAMPPEEKLTDREIADFANWVDDGAVWPIGQTVRNSNMPHSFSDEERSYWAFQPLRREHPPESSDDTWSRNGIDRFVYLKQAEHGLNPAAEAHPAQLLRRVSFDLTGLPPDPELAKTFLSDPSDVAYEQLVDRLLDSPRYGEHWARHWLDVVRYSESDGFRADAYRPHAWRYRDYVIQSLNDDKPYDQFIIEQLAGDEFAPDRADALVATGFLRLYLYEYNQRDARTQWQDILNELTDVTADVFLGLGMGCARCHDHKFDPILQRDYFRLQAFLRPILPRDEIPAASRSEREQFAEALQKWEAETKTLREQIRSLKAPYMERAAQSAIKKFPEDIQQFMARSAEDRSPLEQQIADLVQRQVYFEEDRIKFKDEDAERLKELESRLAEFKHLKPQSLPPALTVSDVGPEAPPTYIPDTQIKVEPGFLSLLDPAPARLESLDIPSTGRRLALARWIANASNPLSTRVIVNRVWQSHFGRGIVSTPSDFGHLGESPTHPRLLDWLTSEFIEHGWSLKHLHRMIVLSSTYRQSSKHPDVQRQQILDPQNRWLWRSSVRRLNAEQIRDALLTASGELNLRAGGAGESATGKRRSVYSKVIRNSPDPLLHAFDSADGFNSTARRSVTTTATQALLLLNGDWAIDRTLVLARTIQEAGHQSLADSIQDVFQRCLGRTADEHELSLALDFLAEHRRSLDTRKEQPRVTTEPLPASQGMALRVTEDPRTGSIRTMETRKIPGGDFTVEAIIQLDSLYKDATVRTICSQWDSNNQHRGWSFGVTSQKSAYQPRNLILQLVGNNGYEVVASNLRPELKRPYYVAVSVAIAESGEAGITFRMKDLSQPNTDFEVSHVSHKNTSDYQSDLPLVIGGRSGQQRHRWNGLIDEIRLTATAIDEHLLAPGRSKDSGAEHLIGFWSFDPLTEQSPLPGSPFPSLKDSSPHGWHLEFHTSRNRFDGPNAEFSGLADLAHVLMLSNEFMYVD